MLAVREKRPFLSLSPTVVATTWASSRWWRRGSFVMVARALSGSIVDISYGGRAIPNGSELGGGGPLTPDGLCPPSSGTMHQIQW